MELKLAKKPHELSYLLQKSRGPLGYDFQSKRPDPRRDPRTDPRRDPRTDPQTDPRTNPRTDPRLLAMVLLLIIFSGFSFFISFSHKWLILWLKKYIFISLSWHVGCGPLLSLFERLEIPILHISFITLPNLSEQPIPLELNQMAPSGGQRNL